MDRMGIVDYLDFQDIYILSRLALWSQVPERRDDWSKPAPISKDGVRFSSDQLTLVVGCP